MKYLRLDILYSIDVVRDIKNSGQEVKWVLQCFRGMSVTYNVLSGLIYGDYNFVGVFDRITSSSTYVSKYYMLKVG